MLPALAESVPVGRAAGGSQGADHGGRGRGSRGAHAPASATTGSDRDGRRHAPAPEPTPFPSASERTDAKAAHVHRRPGSCASPRSSRSSGWPAGTCCSRTSSTRPRPISERRRGHRRGRPAGLADGDPDAGRRDRLGSCRGQRGRQGDARRMRDLAPTSGSTVYTAWAIGGDGVPVALGDFTVGSDGTGTFEARVTGRWPQAPSSPSPASRRRGDGADRPGRLEGRRHRPRLTDSVGGGHRPPSCRRGTRTHPAASSAATRGRRRCRPGSSRRPASRSEFPRWSPITNSSPSPTVHEETPEASVGSVAPLGSDR